MEKACSLFSVIFFGRGFNSRRLHHSLEQNSSLRGITLERRASNNLLFSKGLGVLHILPDPLSTGRIRPVFRLLILCLPRILRFFRTWSESRPIGLTRLISTD